MTKERFIQLTCLEWHPYPEEKPDPKARPQADNQYITTEVRDDGVPGTNVRKWDQKRKCFRILMGEDSIVSAWAELPAPYEG